MSRRPRVLICAVLALVATARIASPQVPDWPSERPPRPLPAREIKFPPYAMRTLSNGLQVIAVSHHEQPAVSVRLLIRAGGSIRERRPDQRNRLRTRLIRSAASSERLRRPSTRSSRRL